MALTLRLVKGSRLTYAEADANFSGLADGSLWSAAVTAASTVLTVAALTVSGLSAAAVPYINASKQLSESGMTWDDVNKRLTITGPGAAAASTVLSVEDAALGSRLHFSVGNTAAANVANEVSFNLTAKTDLNTRTVFQFIGSFSNITDGTRQSQASIAGAQAGTFGNIMTFNGWKTTFADQIFIADGLVTAPGLAFASTPGLGFSKATGNNIDFSPTSGGSTIRFGSDGVHVASGAELGWSDAATVNGSTTYDTRLFREGAGFLALRNGLNAQTFRVYNTYTNSGNFERTTFAYSANVFYIQTEAAGTGSVRELRIGTTGAINMSFITNNTIRYRMNSSGHFLPEADNSYDFGATGTNRPRAIYVAAGAGGNEIALEGIGGRTAIRLVSSADSNAAGYFALQNVNTNAVITSGRSQEIRFYWTKTAGGLEWIGGITGSLVATGALLTDMASELAFQTKAAGGASLATVWKMTSAGQLQPVTDNIYDIGDSTHRVRYAWVGNSLVVGTGGSNSYRFDVYNSSTASGNWARFRTNTGSFLPPSGGGGLFIGWNYSNAQGEAIIAFGTSEGSGPQRISFDSWNGTALAEQFRILYTASAVNYIQVTGNSAGSPPYLTSTGADTNVGMRYLTKGTGGHDFWTNTTMRQFMIAHVASAVNYLQVQGAGTGGAPNFSSQGSDTDVSMSITMKGGGYLAITNGNGAIADLVGAASAVNRWQFYAAATGQSISMLPAGTDTDIGIRMVSKGTGSLSFETGTGGRQLAVAHSASAVNYVQLQGSATTGYPAIGGTGSDVNVGLHFWAKGAGAFKFWTETFSSQQFEIAHTASAVNYLRATGAATGSHPVLSAQGSDANVGVFLASKGTAGINFYTNTSLLQLSVANTAAAVNYVYITGGATGVGTAVGSAGSDTDIPLRLSSKGAGNVVIHTGFFTNVQLVITNVNSSVNYLQAQGATTGSGPVLMVNGETNVNLSISAKGTGSVFMRTNANALTVHEFAYVASSVNYARTRGGTTGNTVTIDAQGSDTNIDLTLTGKGTGVLRGTGAAAVVLAGKNAIPVPASAMSPRSANGCAGLATTNGAANQPDVPYLAFDGAAKEYAGFLMKMPKGWDESTITASFSWRRASGAGAANVVWGIRAVAVSDNDTPAATFGSDATVTDDAKTTTANFSLSGETSACTVGGTPAEGDLVFFEVFRDGASASDTLDAVDAWLTEVTIFLTTNAPNDA